MFRQFCSQTFVSHFLLTAALLGGVVSSPSTAIAQPVGNTPVVAPAQPSPAADSLQASSSLLALQLLGESASSPFDPALQPAIDGCLASGGCSMETLPTDTQLVSETGCNGACNKNVVFKFTVTLLTDKAKNAYKDNALVKALVDNVRSKQLTIFNVPCDTPYKDVYDAAKAGKFFKNVSTIADTGLGAQGLKAGVDYTIDLIGEELLKFLLCLPLF